MLGIYTLKQDNGVFLKIPHSTYVCLTHGVYEKGKMTLIIKWSCSDLMMMSKKVKLKTYYIIMLIDMKMQNINDFTLKKNTHTPHA